MAMRVLRMNAARDAPKKRASVQIRAIVVVAKERREGETEREEGRRRKHCCIV